MVFKFYFWRFQHTATRRWLDKRPRAPARRRGFNTQPPEGGWNMVCNTNTNLNGFNTQPPEGGWRLKNSLVSTFRKSFNTQPPEGGWGYTPNEQDKKLLVSTHSHPKVAGLQGLTLTPICAVSTHSHPKVAGTGKAKQAVGIKFQHTATRRWLAVSDSGFFIGAAFQHTATRRWLAIISRTSTSRMWFQHTATRRWLGA